MKSFLFPPLLAFIGAATLSAFLLAMAAAEKPDASPPALTASQSAGAFDSSSPTRFDNYIGFASEVQIKSPYELKANSEADAQNATFTGIQITGNLYAVKLPCGHVLTVGPGTTIPDHDIPCPCGNPKHFLWKVQP